MQPLYQANLLSIKGLALVLFLITLPLQWISLAQLPGLDFKPAHLSLLCIWGAFLLLRNKLQHLKIVYSVSGGFILFYFVYICSFIIALAWSENLPNSFPVIVKMIVYFGTFILLAALIASCNDFLVAKVIFWGALIGVVIFEVFFVLAFALENKNLIIEYYRAISSGNLVQLRYGFYPKVFKYFDNSYGFGAEGLAYSVALINTLIGAFFLFAFSLKSTTKIFVQRDRNLQVAISHGLFWLCFLIVILSTSRSNLAVFIFGLMVYWYVNKKSFVSVKAMLAVISVLLTAVLIVALMPKENFATYQVILERFGGLADDSRWDMFSETIDMIQEKPILGHGVGTTIWSGHKYLRVHNLFLGSWLEGGLIALIIAIIFYITLLLIWLRFIFAAINSPNFWVLSIAPACVAALPVLPLFRCLISGGSGFFSLIEWACIAIFFGLLARNRIVSKQLSQQPNLTA